MTYQEPLCVQCKAAKATVEISVYRGGRTLEQTLMCAKCAESYERLTFGAHPGVGLVSIVERVAGCHEERAGASASLGCPVCGLALDELLSNGSPGCATCYSRFAEEIDAMMLELHGAVFHRGKTPKLR